MEHLDIIDRSLSTRVRRIREEFWQACAARVNAWLEGLLDLDWNAEPNLTDEDLLEELHFGRA